MAIDLEHFPTNETAQRMLDRVSPIYEKSYVGKWLFEIMGLEMEEARIYFEELRQQAFPERTTWAIEYWERRYAIIPKPTEDLETRRRNIGIKRSERFPMNPARMEAIVNRITNSSSTVTENVEDYTFRVTIDGAVVGMNLLEVLKEIKKRKPSHQNFDCLVIVKAKQPATLQIGSGIGSQVTLGVHPKPDTYDFRRTLYVDLRVCSETVLSVPENTKPPDSTTILRTGTVCTILSNR